jgi:hypothetical protein
VGIEKKMWICGVMWRNAGQCGQLWTNEGRGSSEV